MRIEKLSTDKIRVTVTSGELHGWNINPKKISPDLPQVKEFIASLIEQSYDGIDEEMLNSNILVEARPQGEDFVFVITRIDCDYENIQKQIARSVKKHRLSSGNYTARTVSEQTIEYFAFESLKAFSEMLFAVGHEAFEDTILYKAPNDFYLGIKRNHNNFNRICMIASEYARSMGHDSSFDAYVHEHAVVFAKHTDFEAIKRCYL